MERTKYKLLYEYLSDKYFRYLDNGQIIVRDRKGCSLNSELIPERLRNKLKILYDIINSHASDFNIFEEGNQVLFNSCPDCIDEGLESNNKKYLRNGWVYTIKTTIPLVDEVLVELKEFPGKIFSGCFKAYQQKRRSIDSILKEYGPDLEEDFNLVSDRVRDLKVWNALSNTEKLKVVYDNISGFGLGAIELTDLLCRYIEIDGEEKPLAAAGDIFNDGARNIEVLAYSEIKDFQGQWIYFCKVTELSNNLIEYYTFNQKEMKIICWSDKNHHAETIPYEGRIIRNIVNFNGGIFNTGIMEATSRNERLILIVPPQFKKGTVIQDGRGVKREILMVSPTPNYYGEWVYFCKEHKGQNSKVDYAPITEGFLKSKREDAFSVISKQPHASVGEDNC